MPASVSSLAMIAPVQPKPTSNASTGASLRAMSTPRPLDAAADAHRRQRVLLAVPGDEVRVVVARPRKADQLPARHVAVAAVDRVAPEALEGVLQQLLEEVLG